MTDSRLLAADSPEDYDRKQTAGCNALRARLQSIAILAVQAQDMIGSLDPLADQLDTIAGDLKVCQLICNALQIDRVDVAERIARTGQ